MASTAALLLILACAEVGAPPGGEEDKTSPFLIGSVPVNGATDVPISDRAVLYFSERIVKPRSGVGAFISPRGSTPPELKWKSDHLLIEFPDSFAQNQTYIISVSSDVTDLRNNRLDSSLVVAFSTGSTIDSGAVSGSVFQAGSAKGGALVALYEPGIFADTTPLDSIYPQYVTQSNKSGAFELRYLPPVEYRLVAFLDKSKDERFNPAFELFAVPDRPIDLSSSLAMEEIRLSMTSTDTTTPAIISAAYTSDKTVRLRLSREISLNSYFGKSPKLMAVDVSDTSVWWVANSLREKNLATASTLLFYFGELANATYGPQLFYDPDKPALTLDSMVVENRSDERPPEMTFLPDSLPRFLSQLEMVATFSEPIDTIKFSDETFLLSDFDGNRLKLTKEWVDAFTLKFGSAELASGMTYRMSMAEFEIADLSGNVMGDSLTEFKIATLDDDSLGSVSGDIEVALADKADAPIILTFYNIGTKQAFELRLTEHSFGMDLPAGKYLLSGFIDSDGNGTRDLGSVVPYRFAETEGIHPDTVAIRARFETAGVTFKFR